MKHRQSTKKNTCVPLYKIVTSLSFNNQKSQVPFLSVILVTSSLSSSIITHIPHIHFYSVHLIIYPGQCLKLHQYPLLVRRVWQLRNMEHYRQLQERPVLSRMLATRHVILFNGVLPVSILAGQHLNHQPEEKAFLSSLRRRPLFQRSFDLEHRNEHWHGRSCPLTSNRFFSFSYSSILLIPHHVRQHPFVNH